MSEADRQRWDERYAVDSTIEIALGTHLLPARHLFPAGGRALELACGRGGTSLWLAQHGFEVHGVDVSRVAIAQASRAASANGLVDRCRFEVIDLDAGLPPGPSVDLIVCHLFRNRELDTAIAARLAPGGLLVMATLSEVGAAPGPFRTTQGELAASFEGLEILDHEEGNGVARLVARRHWTSPHDQA